MAHLPRYVVLNARLGRVRRDYMVDPALPSGKRPYLVAPFVSIVPGVLNGSKGGLLYPESEVAANPGVWNGVPLTAGHPADTLTNAPESARQPHVYDRVKLGEVFNDHLTGNGERAGEAWFDEAQTEKKAPAVYRHLLNALSGKAVPSIEISTGLYTDNIPARNGSVDDRTGRPYEAIATNYRPDHLAILEHQKGACSLEDGCGLKLNSNPEGINQYTDRANAAAREAKAALQKHGKDSPEFKAAKAKHDAAWEALQEAHGADQSEAAKTFRSHQQPTDNLSNSEQARDDHGRFAAGPDAGRYTSSDRKSILGGVRQSGYVDAVRPPRSAMADHAPNGDLRGVDTPWGRMTSGRAAPAEDIVGSAEDAAAEGNHAGAAHHYAEAANVFRNVLHDDSRAAEFKAKADYHTGQTGKGKGGVHNATSYAPTTTPQAIAAATAPIAVAPSTKPPKGVLNDRSDDCDCAPDDEQCIEDCLDGITDNAEGAVRSRGFWTRALETLGIITRNAQVQSRHHESGQYLPVNGHSVSTKQLTAAVKAGYGHRNAAGGDQPEADDPDGDGDGPEKGSGRNDMTDGTAAAEGKESLPLPGVGPLRNAAVRAAALGAVAHASADLDDHLAAAAAHRELAANAEQAGDAGTARRAARAYLRHTQAVENYGGGGDAQAAGVRVDGKPKPPGTALVDFLPQRQVANDADEVENDAEGGERMMPSPAGAVPAPEQGTGMAGSPIHIGPTAPTGNATTPVVPAGTAQKAVKGAKKGKGAAPGNGLPQEADAGGAEMAPAGPKDAAVPGVRNAVAPASATCPKCGAKMTVNDKGAMVCNCGYMTRNTRGGVPMKLTAKDRQAAVGCLTTNCDYWKGREALLNNMEDEVLVGLVRGWDRARKDGLLADAARKGTRVGGALTFNAAGTELAANAKAEGSNADVSDSQGTSIEADGNSDSGKGGYEKAPDGIDGDVDESVKPEVFVGDRIVKGKVPGETNNAATLLAQMPAEWREAIGEVVANKAAEKERLIVANTAHVADPRSRAALTAKLRRLDLKELQSLFPGRPVRNAFAGARPDAERDAFLAAVQPAAQAVYGGGVHNARPAPTDNAAADILPMPSLFDGMTRDRNDREDGRRAQA